MDKALFGALLIALKDFSRQGCILQVLFPVDAAILAEQAGLAVHQD